MGTAGALAGLTRSALQHNWHSGSGAACGRPGRWWHRAATRPGLGRPPPTPHGRAHARRRANGSRTDRPAPEACLRPALTPRPAPRGDSAPSAEDGACRGGVPQRTGTAAPLSSRPPAHGHRSRGVQAEAGLEDRPGKGGCTRQGGASASREGGARGRGRLEPPGTLLSGFAPPPRPGAAASAPAGRPAGHSPQGSPGARLPQRGVPEPGAED